VDQLRSLAANHIYTVIEGEGLRGRS
jgi:hypothetical protein